MSSRIVKGPLFLTDITPESVRQFCAGFFSCPAIYDDNAGKYYIVGRRVDTIIPDEVKRRIGSDETVVEVPSALLDCLPPRDLSGKNGR